MAVQSTYGENPTIGIKGQLADSGAHDVISMVNNESSQEMAFGLAVVFEGSTDDQGALAPDAISEQVAGILVHSHAYSNDSDGDLGTTGLKPGAILNVLRKGRIWVEAEEAVSPGDPLWIRAVVTGNEEEGALAMQADSTDMIDSSNQGRWLTTATAGNIALLEVDFTASPTVA